MKFKFKELDLTIVGFKDYYTVMQHIENLKNIDSFCISYLKTEGCSNPDCIKLKNLEESFSPAINFNDLYITQYSIDSLLDFYFSPQCSYCLSCQWKNDEIISTDKPKYFKVFSNLKPSQFIFITFESNLNYEFDILDIYKSSEISATKHDELLYERNKANIKKINFILVDEFKFCNKSYILRGLLTQQFSGHYSSLLINVKEDSLLVKKGHNYLYDDNNNNNELILVENWRDIILDYIPFVALYEIE